MHTEKDTAIHARYCAYFESVTNREKMNGMAASPNVEAAMYAGL
jgi:hypothetical protein